MVGGVVVGGMDMALQQLKQMQLRKPQLKSSDPNQSEEEANMAYVQDLISWVEEMQVRSRAE